MNYSFRLALFITLTLTEAEKRLIFISIFIPNVNKANRTFSKAIYISLQGSFFVQLFDQSIAQKYLESLGGGGLFLSD